MASYIYRKNNKTNYNIKQSLITRSYEKRFNSSRRPIEAIAADGCLLRIYDSAVIISAEDQSVDEERDCPRGDNRLESGRKLLYYSQSRRG